MKKLLWGTLVGLGCSVGIFAGHAHFSVATQDTIKNQNPINTGAKSGATINGVCLYQQAAATSPCVKKINVTTPFVKITQSQENPAWIKVGLHNAQGTVGWLNTKQYRQAQDAFYQPDIQTVFVHVTHEANGKPTYNVVAYKNGQKVTDQQAREFYHKIRREQRRLFERSQAFDNRIHRVFDQDFFGKDEFFNDAAEHQFELPAIDRDQRFQG